MLGMSTQAQESGVPQLTLGWRIRLALDYGGISREKMAATLGVHPSSITRWSHDKGDAPKRGFLLQVAAATGVNPDWLEFGEAHGSTPPGPKGGMETDTPAGGNALDKLTQSKLARSRRSGATTQRYLVAA